MKIRKAKVEDAENILRLHADALQKVNSKDYSPEQIKVWIAKQDINKMKQGITKGGFWVAVLGTHPIVLGTLY